MMLLISVAIAVVIVLGMGFLAQQLPPDYATICQIASVVIAVVVSIVLNLPMLYMMMANSKYKKGLFKEATELYKKAYNTKRLSPDMAIFCGYIFLKEGDKKLAAEVFEKLSAKKLNLRQRHNLDTNRAILLWKEGDITGGVSLLKDVWERGNSVTVAGTLGALMLVKARETEDYSEALDFCIKTNEQYTYEKTILANLGEAYYCTNQNEKALETFEALMDCGSTAPAAYYYYALALLKAGKKEEAEEMLKKSLRQRFSHLSTIAKKTVKAKLEEIEE